MPSSSGSRRVSTPSISRSSTSARISSSNGGSTGSIRTPAAAAIRVRGSGSRGGAASGGLGARAADRAGGVQRAKHEEHVGLVEERERELTPEVARLRVGRIVPALDAVGEEELDPAPEDALDLACARGLGERGKAPDEPRVSPCARQLAVDPARGVEVFRITNQPLDDRLESRVVPVAGERDVANEAAGQAGSAVVLVEHPAHAAHVRLTELLEDVASSPTHPRVAWIDTVLDEQEIRPVRAFVLRAP